MEIKEEERISFANLLVFIERKFRTTLVMGLGLFCDGREMEKRTARLSEMAGSVESNDVMMLEEERVISKSRV